MRSQYDEYRECGAEGFTVHTHGLETLLYLDEAMGWLSSPVSESDNRTALHFIRQARSTMTSIDVDGECPFGGDVTITYEPSNRRETWTCPVCRTEHETEID